MSNKPFLQQFLRYVPLTMLFMLFLFSACKKEKAEAEVAKIDTIPTLVMQIQKCSKLYTAECKMHKIVTHDDKVSLHGKFMETDYNIDLPVGSRKVAIPMDATIKAYIDCICVGVMSICWFVPMLIELSLFLSASHHVAMPMTAMAATVRLTVSMAWLTSGLRSVVKKFCFLLIFPLYCFRAIARCYSY